MTEHGFCSNDTYPDSRMSAAMAKRWGCAWVRTIVYNTQQSYDMVIGSARNRKAVNSKTLVVWNTESSGLGIEDTDENARQLDEFLREANGAIYCVEHGNELDTPEWHISVELMIEIARKGAEVCERRGVMSIAPSIIGDPNAGVFAALAKGVVGHVNAMCLHPYYCSIYGIPDRPELRMDYPPDQRSGFWRFGSVEDKAETVARLAYGPYGLPTWFSELGFPTQFDEITEQEQAACTLAIHSWHHPAIPVITQFGFTDALAPSAEIADGKYWGIVNWDGSDKLSGKLLAEQVAQESNPMEPEFVLGFRTAHDADPELIGDPRRNEYGPIEGWSNQVTTTGILQWVHTIHDQMAIAFTEWATGDEYIFRDDHWEKVEGRG